MMAASKTEDYQLLGEVLDQGLEELGYSREDLSVELFASDKQHVVDLYCSKASAALGLEAERATPKRLGTQVPRTCMHALGTGYARESGEPLGFRPKEGTCASTGAHPPGETSMSRRRRSALPVFSLKLI